MEQYESPVDIGVVIRQISDLYESDQADRLVGYENIDYETMQANDEVRIVRSREIYTLVHDNKISLPPESLYELGILLQHGTVEDVARAQWCGELAFAQGNESGGWLAAAAEDRIEVYNNRPQKWGTQFRKNEAEEWELFPMLTDEESGVNDEMLSVRGIPSRDKLLGEFLKHDDL